MVLLLCFSAVSADSGVTLEKKMKGRRKRKEGGGGRRKENEEEGEDEDQRGESESKRTLPCQGLTQHAP